VLHGVKPRTLSEHPARENPLLLARELDLVDFDEGGGVRRFGGRARIAHARCDFQRAELDRLIDGHFKMRNAARHLVEGSKHGNWILDCRGVRNPARQGDKAACQGHRRQRAPTCGC
jgi:hypothetical protein